MFWKNHIFEFINYLFKSLKRKMLETPKEQLNEKDYIEHFKQYALIRIHYAENSDSDVAKILKNLYSHIYVMETEGQFFFADRFFQSMKELPTINIDRERYISYLHLVEEYGKAILRSAYCPFVTVRLRQLFKFSYTEMDSKKENEIREEISKINTFWDQQQRRLKFNLIEESFENLYADYYLMNLQFEETVHQMILKTLDLPCKSTKFQKHSEEHDYISMCLEIMREILWNLQKGDFSQLREFALRLDAFRHSAKDLLEPIEKSEYSQPLHLIRDFAKIITKLSEFSCSSELTYSLNYEFVDFELYSSNTFIYPDLEKRIRDELLILETIWVNHQARNNMVNFPKLYKEATLFKIQFDNFMKDDTHLESWFFKNINKCEFNILHRQEFSKIIDYALLFDKLKMDFYKSLKELDMDMHLFESQSIKEQDVSRHLKLAEDYVTILMKIGKVSDDYLNETESLRNYFNAFEENFEIIEKFEKNIRDEILKLEEKYGE